jgi:predicted lipoprotein
VTARAARVGVVALVMLLGVAACSDDAAAPTRPGTLAKLADTTIVPRYTELEAATGELVDATKGLCSAKDEASAEAARAALAKSRFAWKSIEAMWIGPVMKRRSASLIDSPINDDDIEALVAATAPETIDPDYVRTRAGSDQRGLRAAEHLLGAAGAAAPVLGEPRRCEYLVAVATVAHDEAAALQGEWSRSSDGGASYRDRFADPSNATDLDAIVNDVFFVLQEITVKELAPALGVTSPTPDPEAVVEGPSGLGVADLQARMTGVRLVLVGDGAKAKGLAPLLTADMTTRLRAALDEADASIAAIQPPLRTALESDPDAVQQARNSINGVQVIVATEVISTLNVKLGFSGNDGDSGG